MRVKSDLAGKVVWESDTLVARSPAVALAWFTAYMEAVARAWSGEVLAGVVTHLRADTMPAEALPPDEGAV